jgi:hypothetical protein
MKRMSVFGIMLMLLIMGMLTSVFDIQSVKAQEDFTVTIGQNKVFTEFNYYDAWFEDDPNNPLPWPEDRSAEDGENWAFVSLGAAAGQAGVAQAQKGLQFEWNLEPYTWEGAKDLPVRIIVDFSYNLEAYYEEGFGSANAFLGFNLAQHLGFGSWYDGANNETIGGNSVETYSTTVGELEAMDRQLLFTVYAQAHATSDATKTHYSSSLVNINSIAIEFDFKITDFGISLGYHVEPNGEETYSQEVKATVFHSQGADIIASFVAIAPDGHQLPVTSENIGSNSLSSVWFEGGLTDPPPLGVYTIQALYKDGDVARVVSWPTDHVSDSVPTITEPANHEVVWTANPTFSWEPFSGATTGYLVEVSGPPEETLPDDDVVWRIALHPTQTHVQFNSDGTAAVPQLTLGGDYRLMVLAFEDIHSGIQSYRDTSIRCIEFSVCSAEMYSPILRFDSREVWFPTACYTRMVSTQNWNIYEFWYRYEFNDLWNVGEALSGGMNPYELPDIVRCMKISDIEDLREKYNHVDDLEIAWIFVNKATGEVEKVRTTVHSWIHSAPIQYWTFDGEHVILYVELGDHGMEHKQWFAAEGQVTQPSLDCIDLEYWFMTGEHNSLNPVVIRDRVNNYRYPDYEGIENAPQTSAQDLHYRMASIHSPASLSVSDSLGRVTGLVDGEEKNEIPFSEYKDGIILIRSPTEPLSWTVKGTGDGTYGLDIVDSDQEGIIFEATDIPITEGATHTYSVDWDVLAQGEAGVTVQVDSDGDGVAEHTFASDSELTQSEYASATGEDGTPPETELNIGEPKIVVNDRTYVTSTAPIALMAEDDSGGSGVASTAYKIYSSAYDSGWITYTEPFYLIGLSDGVYNINYNSTDYVGNVESTNSIQVTLFSWKYTFEDSYGRGTILKINTEHKFFNFKTPDGDYGIIKAMYMQVRRSTIVIFHRDNELTLTTLGIDSRLDFCVAYAKDRQTRKTYWIIDRLGKR